MTIYVHYCRISHMTNPDFGPFNPKVTLERAKDRFREVMLGNDDFFAILSKKLNVNAQAGQTKLPDFSLEPVLSVRGEREFWALRLEYSRTASEESFTARVSGYDYIKLAEYAPSQAMYQPEPELLAELESLGVADIPASAEGLIRQWIAGMDMLHSDPTTPVGIHPMSGTVELLDEEIQIFTYRDDPAE